MSMRKQQSHGLWEHYCIFPSVPQRVLARREVLSGILKGLKIDFITLMKVTAVQLYDMRKMWGKSACPGYLWDVVKFRVTVISNN